MLPVPWPRVDASPLVDARVVVAFRKPSDPASIPHDIEERGVATGPDPEPSLEVNRLFGHHRRSQNRPRSTSQGGDTGSNPVGTTSKSPDQKACLA
jgi:hypothetical protein